MVVMAIMGGTFDPIHYGHLVVAQEVRQELNCDRVLFIPAAEPPHKESAGISSVEHRLVMTRLAVDSNNYFQVSTLEIERPGPSYTIDTVKIVKSKYQPRELYFITGADGILELMTWKKAEEILTLCTFVAVTRPGYDIDNIEEAVKWLPSQSRKKIIPLKVPAMDISSTDIRRRVKMGKSITYLVPKSVENYIKNNGLYL